MTTLFTNITSITRLNKPVGILLLWWPVSWALWLATGGNPDMGLVLVFAAGTILMRSAGCIINDIWDRNIDSQVKRTTSRPLARQSMSLKQALMAFIGLMTLAATLLLYLNPFSRLIALLAACMTLVYPLCKRFTQVPQLFLGLTFNMGILMAFTQVQGSIPPQALLLYAAAISWTLAYDTLYAMQDMKDDSVIGVKSMALLLGEYNIPFISACYAATLTLFCQVIAFNTMLIVAGLLMILATWQGKHQQYHQAFHTNIFIGAALLGGILMGIPKTI